MLAINIGHNWQQQPVLSFSLKDSFCFVVTNSSRSSMRNSWTWVLFEAPLTTENYNMMRRWRFAFNLWKKSLLILAADVSIMRMHSSGLQLPIIIYEAWSSFAVSCTAWLNLKARWAWLSFQYRSMMCSVFDLDFLEDDSRYQIKPKTWWITKLSVKSKSC